MKTTTKVGTKTVRLSKKALGLTVPISQKMDTDYDLPAQQDGGNESRHHEGMNQMKFTLLAPCTR